MEYEMEFENELVKIKWKNGKENNYKGLKKYEIKNCDNKSLIIKNGTKVYYLEEGDTKEILKLIDRDNYIIKYNKSHEKIVMILEDSRNDYIYIYSLDDLKKEPVKMDIEDYKDVLPWNNLHCIGEEHIYCIYAEGISAMNIETLKCDISEVTKYITYYDYEALKEVKKYCSKNMKIDDNNIITHMLMDEKGNKKYIKIKYDPEEHEFIKISETEEIKK